MLIFATLIKWSVNSKIQAVGKFNSGYQCDLLPSKESWITLRLVDVSQRKAVEIIFSSDKISRWCNPFPEKRCSSPADYCVWSHIKFQYLYSLNADTALTLLFFARLCSTWLLRSFYIVSKMFRNGNIYDVSLHVNIFINKQFYIWHL